MGIRPIDASGFERELIADMSLYGEKISGDEAYNRALLLLAGAPTLTPPNEWVSVKERLPDEELKRFKELFPGENEVEVLVMIQGAYTATTLYWDGEKFYDEMSSYEVTHWMPLPEPLDCRPA